MKRPNLTYAQKTDEHTLFPHLMSPKALQQFHLCLGQCAIKRTDQTSQVNHLESGPFFVKNPKLQLKKKRSNCVLHSRRENPFWQEAWRIPRGKSFLRFKNTPGMSFLSSFFHFDLHYSVVRCGCRYLCFFSSRQKASTTKGRERCDRQVHRRAQVTIEKISSHKYPRCQNSNKILSSLILQLLMVHELKYPFRKPMKPGI